MKKRAKIQLQYPICKSPKNVDYNKSVKYTLPDLYVTALCLPFEGYCWILSDILIQVDKIYE